MRKLEARLEKVADEKWTEDAATEDEEATAGLSLYPQSWDTSSAPPLLCALKQPGCPFVFPGPSVVEGSPSSDFHS